MFILQTVTAGKGIVDRSISEGESDIMTGMLLNLSNRFQIKNAEVDTANIKDMPQKNLKKKKNKTMLTNCANLNFENMKLH